VTKDSFVEVGAALFRQEIPEKGKQFVRVSCHLGM
jgi:hypothetical protein